MADNFEGEAKAGTSSSHDGAGESQKSTQFECNICLDTAKDAVISYCGHLFCWPCLHQWLETRPNRQVCPVCKAGIGKEKVVPLYGRGSSSNTDPRTKAPPRPQAQRAEPENRNRRGDFPGGFNLGGDGGVHVSFGIGAFPFGFLGTMFNYNDGRPAPAADSPLRADDEQLSKVFLSLALLMLLWMLFL